MLVPAGRRGPCAVAAVGPSISEGVTGDSPRSGGRSAEHTGTRRPPETSFLTIISVTGLPFRFDFRAKMCKTLNEKKKKKANPHLYTFTPREGD